MTVTKLPALALAATSILVASACTGTPQQPSPEASYLAVDDLPGKPISEVDSKIGKDTLLYVQDASPVVGIKPSYNASQQSSDQWIILAACADSKIVDTSKKIEVSVIPAVKFSSSVKSDIHKKAFRDTVRCS